MIPLKRLLTVAVALAAVWGGAAQGQDRVDNSTLDHKFILGFQGWFACPGDGNAKGWVHWFNAKGEATVDLLPDVSELPAEERCETGMTDRDNRPVEVFSDQRYSTVLRQFEWMRDYHLDGVALQRFVVGIDDPSRLARSDRVLDNVRRAAEATGRVFFVQYDIAGAGATEWPEKIEADWLRLLNSKIVDSPAYLHHNGKPVVGIAGPGVHGKRFATPEQTLDFLNRLRELSAQNGANLTLFGFVPRGWRTLTLGARTEPGWAKVYRSYDVISPWTVGAVRDSQGIDNHVEKTSNLIWRRRGVWASAICRLSFQAFPGPTLNMTPVNLTSFREGAVSLPGSRLPHMCPRERPCCSAPCSMRSARALRSSKSSLTRTGCPLSHITSRSMPMDVTCRAIGICESQKAFHV